MPRSPVLLFPIVPRAAQRVMARLPGRYGAWWFWIDRRCAHLPRRPMRIHTISRCSFPVRGYRNDTALHAHHTSIASRCHHLTGARINFRNLSELSAATILNEIDVTLGGLIVATNVQLTLTDNPTQSMVSFDIVGGLAGLAAEERYSFNSGRSQQCRQRCPDRMRGCDHLLHANVPSLVHSAHRG